MAQIGYGYGSEYHLMRFLGHHRHLFEDIIRKVLNEQDGQFDWLDFEFENPMNSISGDKELKGISFLGKIIPEAKFNEVNKEYHSYKINRIDNWQNWDAIFTLNGIIYLVEAKAHVSELSSDGTHGGKSSREILSFFNKELLEGLRLKGYNVTSDEKVLLGDYYQLVNRLATAAFLNNNGVKTKCLYIYFTNGYNKRTVEKNRIMPYKNDNASKEDFLEKINEEYNVLVGGNKEALGDLLVEPVFINAENGNND